MDLTLIPFGQEIGSNKLVDVYDVPSGKKCGCICPSCKLPLIARHGAVKVWHFAHNTNEVPASRIHNCQYSFFLSVRMMASQILSDSLSIKVPEYVGVVTRTMEDPWRIFDESFVVCPAQSINLSNLVANSDFDGVKVDAYANVNDFAFILYFTHPGRNIPTALRSPNTQNSGIIAISLASLADLFKAAGRSKDNYKSILLKHIAEDLESKKWIHHPRYRKLRDLATDRITKKITDFESKRQTSYIVDARGTELKSRYFDNAGANRVPKMKIEKTFNCLLCGAVWKAVEDGRSSCPSCGQAGSISSQ